MKRLSICLRLVALMRPLWAVMSISAFMRVCNQLAGMALLAAAVWGVTRVAAGDSPGSDPGAEPIDFGLWVGGLIALGMFKGLSRYLEQFTGHYVAFHLLTLLRIAWFRAIEPIAPAGLTDMRSGDLVARAIGDIDRIEPFYAHTIAPVIAAVIVPASVLVALGFWDLHLVWPLLAGFLTLGVVVPLISNRLSQGFSRSVRAATGEVNAHLTDSLQGLREVVAFGYGDRRVDELHQRGTALSRAQERLARIAAVRNAVTEGLVAATIMGLLVVSLWRANTGHLDILDVPVVMALGMASMAPVLAVAAVIDDFQQAMAAAERLFDIMDREPVDSSAPGAAVASDTLEVIDARGEIRFEGVHFAYQRDGKPVLQGVDLAIPAGKTVAVVGPSGAGKSTLVHLLVRFWPPTRGRIVLGPTDISDIDPEALRQHIAVVSQHTYLFDTTIGDNIRLGNPAATQTEIEHAARAANLHTFIESLPRQYDTLVGEMGGKLSGGQRQRIGIARALVKDAPILILDEATANVDAGTERDIRQAMMRLAAGRTTLWIAHRLATVVDADDIAVLDRGRIVEQGPHATLLAAGGVYARLFAHQQDTLDEHLFAATKSTKPT